MSLRAAILITTFLRMILSFIWPSKQDKTSNHRNLKTSLSSSATDTFRNAFSMSPVSAFLCVRNLRMMSMTFWESAGSVYKLRLTYRTYHKQFWVFFFICLFRWQHDEAGSEPFRLHQRLAHWLSPQSPLRPGLRSRHHSLVTLVILVSGGSTDSSGVCGWSLSCLSELGECPSMLDVFHTFHAERRCCQWTDYELIVQDSIFPMTLRPRSVWAIQ